MKEKEKKSWRIPTGFLRNFKGTIGTKKLLRKFLFLDMSELLSKKTPKLRILDVNNKY